MNARLCARISHDVCRVCGMSEREAIVPTVEQLRNAPPHPYVQQVARAYRFLDRYRLARSSVRGSKTRASFEEIEDFLWAFFQNCWHIKDWLRNDRSVAEAAKAAVLRGVNANADLLAVADLANGSKHLGRAKGRERIGAEDSGIQFNSEPGGGTTVDHLISIRNGETVSALDLGMNAMMAWQRLLRDAGLFSFESESRLEE